MAKQLGVGIKVFQSGTSLPSPRALKVRRRRLRPLAEEALSPCGHGGDAQVGVARGAAAAVLGGLSMPCDRGVGAALGSGELSSW